MISSVANAAAHAMGLPSVWINRRSGRDGWGATPAPDSSINPDFEFDSMASFAKAVDAAFA
jgi:FMN phosphatase YigB (HAD superfamily)